MVELTTEELKAQVAALTTENKDLKVAVTNAKSVGTSIKISPKGGVSFYGTGRFPVTLYKSQWLKLFAKIEEIKAFITANDDKLATKE